MNIVAVTSPELGEQFIAVNVKVNAGNSSYIRPLDKEINETFDYSKNKHLQYSKVCRWILLNEANEAIGRIAAFTSTRYICKGTDFKIGCFGYFDCINNQEAANMLFNQAKEWLMEQGIDSISLNPDTVVSTWLFLGEEAKHLA